MLIVPKTWEDNANIMEIRCVNIYREVGDNSPTYANIMEYNSSIYANIMEDNSPTYANIMDLCRHSVKAK